MREEELAAQQEHLIAARLDMPEYKPEIKIEAGGDDERRKNVLEAERQVITELETTTKLKKIVKGDVAMNAVSNSLRRMEDVIPQNTGKFKSFQEAKTLCGRFF